MRTLILGLCGLLVAGCGDDKNTTDGDTSTGGTGTAGASTSTTGSTADSSGDDGASEPTTAGETDATSTSGTTGGTTHTSHSSVTGESSSSAGSTEDPGSSGSSGSSGADGGESSGTSGGVEPAGTAIVENDCAPNDGAALQFKMEVTEPVCGAALAGEQLRVMLWQGGPLAPGVYPVGEQTGFATYQVGNNEPVNSVDGTLTIDSWEGGLVIGSYDLTFVDDSARQGVFAGPFCQVNIPCG